MKRFSRLAALIVAAGVLAAVITPAPAAESTEFRVARQPGVVYLQRS